MKRTALLILILLLAFQLASCGGSPEEAAEEGGNTVAVSSEGTENLVDESWMKTADENEIDGYYEAIYSEEDSGKKIREASLELYKALASSGIDKGENTMISPLSFLSAMGLLENGAEGQTLSEIEEAFGMTKDSFNSWYDAWTKLLILNGNESLRMANSVWYRNDPHLKVSEKYLRTAGGIFDAEVFSAAFDDATLNDINGWVKENTNEMIPSILDSIPKDAMMFLINATCFEGSWLKDYEDDQIMEDETFTKEDGTEQKATLLYSLEEKGTYFETDTLSGTSKPYANGFEITFLLPKEGNSLQDLVDNLNGDEIEEIRTNGMTADVNLYIPEFSFDYTAPDCIGALKSMGIETVFDEDLADLSPMAVMDNGYNLSVNEVIHKTRIELDREGTRASASTAIGIVKNTSIMEEVPIKEVRLDRPFMFIISDQASQVPVFMGTVAGM